MYKDRNQGFTLVEMAVVLIIVGLLIGGLLVPLTAQLDIRNYNETRQKIDTIKEAIMGFALVNGRLPCPASPTVASSEVGAGTESCALDVGVVPWADLGTPELDAWGGRFTYAVTSPLKVDILLTSNGALTVNNLSGGSVGLQLPVVVISHGKNGFGAYQVNGTQASTTGATAAELENLNGISPFVFGETMQNGYDDFVEWLSLNVLFNRMVLAGRLP
ncbi:MAG: prepilin-type N-terminal cleavage/methylation domain-containing protein [Methylotenera sp.]|nr:prepilin-type N-terminal cleavage/methylation domain-containing protein [Methylotenera sp.]